jgi:aryl-alcohol dehydrogenase-like predicted oxidoreductase
VAINSKRTVLVRTRRIGTLDVSVVGLGCNNFGNRIDEAQTARVVHAAIDAGINFLDTADIYGRTRSEEFLGRVLKGRHDRVIIATKFGKPVDEQKRGASPAYIRQAVEDSLRRLATDRIDLYQQHDPDPAVPIADTLGALDDLVRAGKVREIGCSNFSAAQLREAEAAAGRARFVSVQNEYSLLVREAEAAVLPECDRLGIAFLPYYPLASGLLTGKYRRGQPVPANGRIASGWGAKLMTDQNMTIVEHLIAFAESRGRTLLELSMSWLLARPVVASVIAGATTADQVRANAAAADWVMSDDELTAIRTIIG